MKTIVIILLIFLGLQAQAIDISGNIKAGFSRQHKRIADNVMLFCYRDN